MEALQAVTLEHEGTKLVGEMAMPAAAGPHPAVLVMHNAFGLGDHMRSVARQLAAQGYVALASDMYGGGLYTEDESQIGALVMPLWGTALLRSRVVTWFEHLRSHGAVIPDRIAAIGYCFGGQCVLELARSGADVKAVVSYHGILTTHERARPGAVRARVAVYTGALDPHVPRGDVDALRDEMIAAGANWHITEFGNSYHAFTDPDAATPQTGRAYDPLADKVSWAGTLSLLSARLQDR
jgi:dienelactone hydrolase